MLTALASLQAVRFATTTALRTWACPGQMVAQDKRDRSESLPVRPVLPDRPAYQYPRNLHQANPAPIQMRTLATDA
jgi:hypothetical protein